jgi:hypothetical protein
MHASRSVVSIEKFEAQRKGFQRTARAIRECFIVSKP